MLYNIKIHHYIEDIHIFKINKSVTNGYTLV